MFANLDRTTAREKAAAGATGLGLIGAIAGGIVGHLHQTDRWQTIIATKSKVAAARVGGSRLFALGVRVSGL